MYNDNHTFNFGNDIDGYLVPKYDDLDPVVNLETYTAWRELWATKAFEAILDGADSNSVIRIAEVALGLPYHPDFPEVFFAYLVGRLDGCPPLEPEEVEDFLTRMYANGLERPDCDYLLAAIQNQNLRYAVQAPKNIDRAVCWLEAKRYELPAWPPQANRCNAGHEQKSQHNYSDSSAQGRVLLPLITTNDQKQSNMVTGHPGYQDHRTNDAEKSIFSPLDQHLLPPYSLSVFKELLRELGLPMAQHALSRVNSSSAWVGVIYALREKRLIGRNGLAIANALREMFGAKVSVRAIQDSLAWVDKGIELKTFESKDIYELAIGYLQRQP